MGKNKILSGGSTKMADTEHWIPILDYAVLRGVSTSTLRRYIKAQKVKFKIENGRYLLWADEQLASQYNQSRPLAQPFTMRPRWDSAAMNEGISVFTRVRELEEQLIGAQEQINELKMLVAIYEEKLGPLDH